jgi:DNA-binding GntR family transcriptional regulator
MITTDKIALNEDKTQMVQKIQEAILEGICLLDYRAGYQFKEAEIAAEFGVSRTPVRDALSRIAHLDLIETRNGVGTIVKPLTHAKIADVYETRLRLAPLIGELSLVIVEASHLASINHLLQRAKTLTSMEQARSYMQINHELQQLLCQLISNTVLQSFWQQTYYQAASVWYRIVDTIGIKAFSSLVAELSELERALQNNDLNAVGYIQKIYIGYGYERIKTHLFSLESA